MNKLYLSPSGVIKVIDVPEEPTSSFCFKYKYTNLPCNFTVCNCMEKEQKYLQTLAAAKEAGIKVEDQEHAKEIIYYELYGGPQVDIPWSVTVKNWSDKIFDLPKGWRVEIKENQPCRHCNLIDCYNHQMGDCKNTIAVLVPPSFVEPSCTQEAIDAMPRFTDIPDAGKMVESQEVTIDELIAALEDKRILKFNYSLSPDMYYLSRKQIAEDLLDRYIITRKP